MKIALAVVWALIVFSLLILGLKLLNDYVLTPERTISLRSSKRPLKREEREIRICFADENALYLVVEKRLAELGGGAAADARVLMFELAKGPQSAGALPTIPADTRLLNAYELGDTLVLDFTHEIQTNHTRGSAGELLTVYSIVNTMIINLHGIERIQILVEGQEIETLAGHLDLTRPLGPNLKWIPELSGHVTGGFKDLAGHGKTVASRHPRIPRSPMAEPSLIRPDKRA